MKKLFTSIALILVSGILVSQTNLDWQNESFLHFTVNPALVTESDALTLGVQHARKWQHLSSSPVSYSLSALMPFKNDRMGLGLWINNNEIGPLTSTSVSLNYAYSIPIGMTNGDKLSLGISSRITSLRFDQTQLVAGDLDDQLLNGANENSVAPPNVNVGFFYTSGKADYTQPVQLNFGGSFARYIPFADRFNTLVYNRSYQWYGMAGLDFFLMDETNLKVHVLVSDMERDFFNKAARVTLENEKLGWVTVQYNDRRDLLTQVGVNLRVNQIFDDLIRLSGSYGMSFGPIGSQVGNGLSFGVSYLKSLN